MPKLKKRRVCKVEHCDRKHFGKGYCERHYKRMRSTGTTEVKTRRKKIEFEITERGCFHCISHSPDAWGYPKFKVDKKQWIMSRWIYTQMFGEIPEGLIVRHTCDNPACINPEHLILGTHKDNAEDRVSRGRGAKGSRSGSAKLTEEQVLGIKQLLKEGKMTNREIARLYSIEEWNVSFIKTNRTWKHVKI